MTCQIKRSSVASFILATTFFCNSFGQEAEKIYHNEYSKLSFVVQPSILKGFWVSDNDSDASFNFENNFSAQFGVSFNFAQSKNFNFKTGLIAKMFYPKFNVNISKENAGTEKDLAFTHMNLSQQFVISMPLKTTYFYPITDKINLLLVEVLIST